MIVHKEVGFYISINNQLEFIETSSKKESEELIGLYVQSKKIQDYVIFKNRIRLNEEEEINLRLLGLKMYNRIIDYPKDTYSSIVSIRFESIKKYETKLNKVPKIEINIEKKENIKSEESNSQIKIKQQGSNYFSELSIGKKILAILAYPFGLFILVLFISFIVADLISSMMYKLFDANYFFLWDIRTYIHIPDKIQIILFFCLSITFLTIYSIFLFKKINSRSKI